MKRNPKILTGSSDAAETLPRRFEPVERSPAPQLGERAATARTKILTAARKLFIERGYGATQVNDIAAEAKVGRPTVYTYFSSKRDILLVLAEQDTAVFQEIVEDARVVIAGGSDRDSIRKWLRQYLDYLSTGFGVILVWNEAAAGDEKLREVGLRYEMRAWQNLGMAINSKRKQGADAALDGMLLLSMLERVWFYCDVVGAPFTNEQIVDRVSDLMLAMR